MTKLKHIIKELNHMETDLADIALQAEQAEARVKHIQGLRFGIIERVRILRQEMLKELESEMYK